MAGLEDKTSFYLALSKDDLNDRIVCPVFNVCHPPYITNGCLNKGISHFCKRYKEIVSQTENYTAWNNRQFRQSYLAQV